MKSVGVSVWKLGQGREVGLGRAWAARWAARSGRGTVRASAAVSAVVWARAKAVQLGAG